MQLNGYGGEVVVREKGQPARLAAFSLWQGRAAS
jgi:hypothetical protein